jgi:CBS domain containing-hemolysin-like protein
VTALALVALLALVLLNGFFVAAEFALVRTRRGRIEALAAEGARGADTVLSQLDQIDRYLAACQLGITMASLGIGFLGEPAIAALLEPLLEGPLGEGAAIGISIALAFTIATVLHITVGEQVPKMVAINRAEGTSRLVAPPLHAFRVISAPFTWGLSVASNAMVRLFGVDPERIEEHHDADDLRSLILTSGSQGDIEENEATMLSGVFHLHEQEAREVMTPIPAVITVDSSDTVEDALKRCVSSGHTRLVAIEDDNPDRVRGLVHNNSIARLYMSAGADASIEPAIREAPIVPETKPLDDLLAELQRQRSSMAVVVDEYGRTVGIATIEDILEEVVGEIEDETDPRGDSVRRLADGDWYVRGHVSLGDLEDAGIELAVETDAYNSIGGYVFSELGRLPKRGDTIRGDRHTIRVESVRNNRIVALRIHPLGPSGEAVEQAVEPGLPGS